MMTDFQTLAEHLLK